jgi:hypothetical protein
MMMLKMDSMMIVERDGADMVAGTVEVYRKHVQYNRIVHAA